MDPGRLREHESEVLQIRVLLVVACLNMVLLMVRSGQFNNTMLNAVSWAFRDSWLV